jgi:DNA-binding NtrC family response regulator
LINHILNKHPVAQEKKIKQVKPQVLDQMLAYHWPGNIRELENILERAIVKSSGDLIEDVDLAGAAPASGRSILRHER